ncbi:hypothetical protein H4R18_004930 [Coemansia javaensis]|uniref:Uncharacterized protein n=1 Tax=Coemansia javaensis TaxID=2761396 RepID=A0A9W8H468_9FUNG|nr:hypothetical protein H4R18_004930 [Coemansia javaensis]
MRVPRPHFTEPGRQRSGPPGRAGAYGSATTTTTTTTSPLGSQSMDIVPAETGGCVPAHRSVFRLFRRKVQAHASPSQPDLTAIATASAAAPSARSSVTGDLGGYLRSRKGTRGTTLSAQRTCSEFAVAGPAPKPTVKTPATASPNGVQPKSAFVAPARGLAPLSPPLPLRSASSTDVASLLRQLETEVDRQTVSDDEVLGAEAAVHVAADDSSDWNSDFSSPTSWRHPSAATRTAVDGARLKDRALDRGVLEAQHRILQQEKHLMQISSLSGALAKLRPLILRCLVFELPDRAIQIGTSTFVSEQREPCGSVEPSVEEERLWELWRQAEALLTIMDNDAIPLDAGANRLTLSKKRAIMLAFCDWEQYSTYVQDAWDSARRGIAQPERRSSAASSLRPPPSGVLSRFSLSRHRKPRRRSVVSVAPASLQRISDMAHAIQDECERLLALMSPLYREAQSALHPAAPFSPDADADAATVTAEKPPSVAASGSSAPAPTSCASCPPLKP